MALQHIEKPGLGHMYGILEGCYIKLKDRIGTETR